MFHQKVPRDLALNLKFRKAIRRHPRDRARILDGCKHDILFFINSFVWQYNPNSIGKGSLEVGPFITWVNPEVEMDQDRAVAAIQAAIRDRKDLFIEKSREMGASWLCLLVLAHRFLFFPRQKFLVISRSQEAVDRPGDTDSLFWKLGFIFDHLPTWMLPRRMGRIKNIFSNGDLDSSITGQASTGKAGVGGRATCMFIDEFSMIDEDFEVLHRTSDTTGCRIFNGTHRGTGTAFHELSQRVDMRKIVLHWTQHPDKRKGLYRFYDGKIEVLDKSYHYPPEFEFTMSEAPAGGPHPGIRSPWYDEQPARKGGNLRAIAMDLDIDPAGSAAQFFNPVTIRQLRAMYVVAPLWEGDICFDADTGKPLHLVEMKGGPLKLWVQPKADGSMPRSVYGAGADVSTGQGTTNSCISIIDARTGRKVAEYATPRLSPQQLAPVATALCWLFTDELEQPAKLAWEHVGPGQVCGKKILELGFRHIHFRASVMSVGGFKETEIPGWFPTPEQKLILLTEYRSGLETRMILNPSDDALRECLYYRYCKDGTVESSFEQMDDPTGARLNHGDRVIADALAWKMAMSFNAPRQKEKERIAIGSLAWRRQLRHNRQREESA